jgi:predicted nuclease of predicted toxin-antitoxin system
VRLPELRWLSDEGIAPEVVEHLRRMNWNVITAAEAGVRGRPDTEVLAAAFSQGRAVITHDSDFGTLAIAGGRDCVGIIYLRPGHIDPAFTIAR